MHYLILLLLELSISSTYQAGYANIVITISGIDERSGIIRVGIYDKEDSFLKHSLAFKAQQVTQRAFKETFAQMPPGTYAISVYHDENSNGVLDSNLIRIPREPYGFSNNPNTTFGPPTFQEASFIHSSRDTHLTITLK